MNRNSSKKKHWLLRLFMFLLIGGVVAGVIAYFAVSAWIQNYLRSDALRKLLAGQIGHAAHARCELEPVSWTGWNAYSARVSLQPEGARRA